VKLVLSTAFLFALAWAALMFSGAATLADLLRFEWLLAGVGVVAAAASWRAIASRRERQKLEAMRDSALW
jgi:membrane protein implicated in regulation of membrane protease activity